MNPQMACSSVLTSSETICGDVISSCIINKANKTLTVSIIATCASKNVNLLLGLSRNDHTAMLDVLHYYFNTHNKEIFKYYVIHVNLLLGLSRNDHTAMLDVLHYYFNTHNKEIFKYYVIHACFSPRKR